jgi:hypothetical protein
VKRFIDKSKPALLDDVDTDNDCEFFTLVQELLNFADRTAGRKTKVARTSKDDDDDMTTASAKKAKSFLDQVQDGSIDMDISQWESFQRQFNSVVDQKRKSLG